MRDSEDKLALKEVSKALEESKSLPEKKKRGRPRKNKINNDENSVKEKGNEKADSKNSKVSEIDSESWTQEMPDKELDEAVSQKKKGNKYRENEVAKNTD